MNAIVMNTLTGAVSEYSNFDFQSITPTHAGSATGLFLLGGDLDLTAPIVAQIETGKTLWNTTVKKHSDIIYFAMRGTGNARLTVVGENSRQTYNFPVREAGVSRCQPGKGIRENYLAFGLSNPNGEMFTLDRIEVTEVKSKARRVA